MKQRKAFGAPLWDKQVVRNKLVAGFEGRRGAGARLLVRADG